MESLYKILCVRHSLERLPECNDESREVLCPVQRVLQPARGVRRQRGVCAPQLEGVTPDAAVLNIVVFVIDHGGQLTAEQAIGGTRVLKFRIK